MKEEKSSIDLARTGVITQSMEEVAKDEYVSDHHIAEGIASGTIVVTMNFQSSWHREGT